MQLQPDSPKLGQLGEQGQILHWPATDVNGGAYTREHATTRRVSHFLFVVIPSGGLNEAIEIVTPKPVKAPKGKVTVDESDD